VFCSCTPEMYKPPQQAFSPHISKGYTAQQNSQPANCLEALLDLPECRVIDQVLGPTQLALHLERRENAIVCPRCQTCCSGVKESRLRCLRDWPILERPTVLWLHVRRFECRACQHRPWEKSETFGPRTKWTERLYNQVRQEFLRGCPGKALARRYGLSARSVFRFPPITLPCLLRIDAL
jgi:transposase